MAIDIVDALEAVQIQHQHAVTGAGSWGCGDGNFERIVELPAIWESSEDIVKCQRSDFVLGCGAAGNLTPFSQQPPDRPKQSHEQNSDHRDQFVEFKCLRCRSYARGIREDIEFEAEIKYEQGNCRYDNQIDKSEFVTEHERSYGSQALTKGHFASPADSGTRNLRFEDPSRV
jgi:hypothetical protein